MSTGNDTSPLALTGTGSVIGQVVSDASFLAAIPIGLVIQSASGEIIDCNEAASSIFGMTPEEYTSAHANEWAWNVVDEDGRPIAPRDTPIARTIATGVGVTNELIGIDCNDRPRRWVLETTWAIENADGAAAIASLADVTEQIQERNNLRLLTEINHFGEMALCGDDPLSSLTRVLVATGCCDLARVVESPGGVGLTTLAVHTSDPLADRTLAAATPLREALKSHQIRVTDDILVSGEDPTMLTRGYRSLAAIPFGNGLALSVASRRPFAFNSYVLRGLEDALHQVAFVLEHLRSVQRVNDSLEGTIAVVSALTEFRDPYTEGHQIRVGVLAERIAHMLGVSSEMASFIRQAGEVHDVGKIACPAEILSRPGRLSVVEFEVVKQHSQVGFNILSQADLPWPIAMVALQHHERLDGSGYPNGLKDEEIILPARIVAVADVVEAMSQHRPYRSALGLATALDEIREGAGRLYDADVVEACLAVFDRGFSFAGPSTLPTAPLAVGIS